MPQSINNFEIEEFLTKLELDEVSQAKQDLDEVDDDLRLEIPPEAPIEQHPYWTAFFRMIRRMYLKEFMTREYVDTIYEVFYNQDLEAKEKSLNGIYETLQEHEKDMETLEVLWDQEEVKDLIEDIVERLPDEQAQEFLYFIENGEDMPDHLKKRAANSLEGDQLAIDKLERVFNQGYQLDVNNASSLRNPSLPQPTGQAMSPQDLLRKFNVSSQSAPNLARQAPRPQPSPAPQQQPAAPHPIKQPQVDQTQMKSVEDLAKAEPEGEKHEIKSPKNLDDLLK